jgi:glyoxylase-like metal-dependent hydrolase (beta-lactamase superfamily II)
MKKTYCFGACWPLTAAALLFLVSPGADAQPSGATAAPAVRTTAGPITRPMIAEIAKDTYFINEFGMDSQYLVVGEKRALVIDTGTGFYDMKELIGRLTNLPYDVAVTHGHPDHAGGIGQFDTVYMHPADVDAAKRLTYEGAVQYGETMWNMPIGYRGVWGYTPADARRFTRFPEFKPLAEGNVFDLGGRKLTVYEAPGHTLGSIVLIDDQSRILFSGDAANGNVGAVATSVSTLLRGLIKLQKLRTSYDRQYTGHISYAGTIDVISQSPQVLDDVVEAFRSLLRGNANVQVVKNHLFPERTQTVAVYGRASVGFNPDRLWEPGEEHIVP